MPRKVLKLGLGLRSVKIPESPSEPGYVAAVNAAVKALTRDMLSAIQQIKDATPEIIMDILEPTYEKAKVYCPKDTGDLVESAYLESTGDSSRPRVEMGFAKGGFPRYAVYVHEMVQYRHEAPTQAKFLERAVNEDLGELPQRIEDRYRRFMGG